MISISKEKFTILCCLTATRVPFDLSVLPLDLTYNLINRLLLFSGTLPYRLVLTCSKTHNHIPLPKSFQRNRSRLCATFRNTLHLFSEELLSP